MIVLKEVVIAALIMVCRGWNHRLHYIAMFRYLVFSSFQGASPISLLSGLTDNEMVVESGKNFSGVCLFSSASLQLLPIEWTLDGSTGFTQLENVHIDSNQQIFFMPSRPCIYEALIRLSLGCSLALSQILVEFILPFPPQI